jgi:hypothetical protein
MLIKANNRIINTDQITHAEIKDENGKKVLTIHFSSTRYESGSEYGTVIIHSPAADKIWLLLENALGNMPSTI